MKCVVSVLVLLFSCLPGAWPQQDRDDSVKNIQETCQPDIHTVLREMTASMAEQRTELKQTQAQLQTLLDQLKTTESQMEEVRKQNREQSNVAFAASLGVRGNTGPFNTDTTVAYRNIFTNTGNAYNSNTGIFTAPVRGLYYFSFSGCNQSSKPMGLQLFKNGVKQVTVYNHAGGTTYETSTNGITLELYVGEQVYIRLLANTWLADSENNHNTFIGHLLFPLI
ncbi:complement C1q tumor necrosis factor-related protein 3-like [Esox lucius]|uniref:C1q domain-containing protein n=1 Tax=Esox lucius TaxID=8010 RepID=A0A3P8XJ63_ESOLU|nr:complement C1q tumor necrosis factor-related protein 3-like [Esox lucius]